MTDNLQKVDDSVIQNELEQMAYFNWLNAGKPNGKDIEFWCDAEREMFGFTLDEFINYCNIVDIYPPIED